MNKSRIWRELSNRFLAMRLAFAGRTHQYPEILALRRFISAFAVDALFDVGANYGQYAQMLRKDVGYEGLIFSFEPNPAAYDRLSAKAARDSRWHVFNLALSDFDGTVPFNIMAADQFSSIERPAEALDEVFTERNKVQKTVDVVCRTMHGIYHELRQTHGFSRPFLKMDTQGHDKSVCEGAGETLWLMLGVQSELAVRPLYDSASDYRTMIAWLDARGFVPNAFFANNKGHFPLLVEMDGIFIRADLGVDTP